MSKLSRVLNTLGRGFASIADGMGQIMSFRTPDYTNPGDYLKDSKYKRPGETGYIKPLPAAEAMRRDWQRVGQNMQRAIDKVAAEHNLPQNKP